MPKFALETGGMKLRSYQTPVALAVCRSILQRQGLSFVVMFPRQSGKNELQAQIEAYLLTLYSQTKADLVKVSPTAKPQSLNAMRRLERVLKGNICTHDHWRKDCGYIYRLGTARITFLSGEPTAQIVGATANVLLEVDEAQDVETAKYDKEIAPMAASTNATRIFWGTAWTSQTLLARELRLARQAEQADGIQRAFVLTADQVAQEVPAYGRFVQEQVSRLGRQHPLVRTQYYSEEVDAQGGLFPASRQAIMQGRHPSQTLPLPMEQYVFTIDIAGADETPPPVVGAGLRPAPTGPAPTTDSGRDATALTIVQLIHNP